VLPLTPQTANLEPPPGEDDLATLANFGERQHLSNSVFIAKLAGRDALLTGTAELIHDAVHSALDAFGLQQAKAMITLLDT
jgi:hypothetical protein